MKQGRSRTSINRVLSHHSLYCIYHISMLQRKEIEEIVFLTEEIMLS